eukprot:1652436-Prymnesium_polylepis.1
MELIQTDDVSSLQILLKLFHPVAHFLVTVYQLMCHRARRVNENKNLIERLACVVLKESLRDVLERKIPGTGARAGWCERSKQEQGRP